MIIKRNKEFSFSGFIKKFNNWALKREKNKKIVNHPLKNNSSRYAQHTNPTVDEVSPKHPILRKIFDDVYNKYNPGWGDGDEYPTFHITSIDFEDLDTKIGDIETEHQSPWIYRYDGKGWVMIEDPTNPRISSKSPKRIPNLKQELLRIIKIYRKEWEDEECPGTTEEDREGVLNYLDHLEIKIKKANI